VFVAAAAAAVIGGCSSAVAPAETFDWRGKSITFAPPPPAWRREGINEGGMLGVYFVLTGSVGERIFVADHYIIADRDRRAALDELLERLNDVGDPDDLDHRELAHAISLARWRTEDPLSPLEADIAREGNYRLDRASLAVFNEGRPEVHRQLVAAREEAERMHLELKDVLDRVKFKAKGHHEPVEWKVVSEGPATVAGVPAWRVDYTWQSTKRLYYGRELYFVSDNHVFTASFHGLEQNLLLFDRIAASITFPPADSTKAGEPGVGVSVATPTR